MRHIGHLRPTLYISVGLFMGVLAFFNNCSDVDFQATPESRKQNEDPVTGGQGDPAPREKPSLVINQGEEYTNQAEVFLSLNSGTGYATEMLISNDSDCSSGTWEPYVRSRTWPIAAANQEFQLYAKFKIAGEGETECVSDGITHDNIAPTIQYANTNGRIYKTEIVPVRFTATDNLSGVKEVTCFLPSGSGFEPCPLNPDLKAQKEGSQLFQARAMDHAGNLSESFPLSWVVDLTPPKVQINKQPSNLTPLTLSAFEFEGSDAVTSIRSYECRFSATEAFQTCSSGVSRTLASGPQQFEVRAIDQAFNVSPVAKYNWTIDTDAPNVQITKSPNAYTNIAIANLEFNGMDGATPITVFQCRIPPADFASCKSPFASPALSEGSHKFEVQGQDAAGNWSGTASASWTLDLTAPSVTIVSGPSGLISSLQAVVQFQASDELSGIAKRECSLNGAAFSDCEETLQINTGIIQGNNELRVRAVDRAGNISPIATHKWSVDSIAPVVQITSGPAPMTNLNEAQFTYVATDNSPVSFQCQLDTGGFMACPTKYSDIPQGLHVFYVVATDSAGNRSLPATYQWTVDTSAPSISFLKEPKDIFRGDKTSALFEVIDSLSGVKSVTCKLNGDDLPCQSLVELNFAGLTVGTNVLDVRAEDNLGQFRVATRSWEVTIKILDMVKANTVKTNRPVDVLVVVDNSGSMDYERSSFNQRLNYFIDKLDGLDWRIGLTTTDPYEGRWVEGPPPKRTPVFEPFLNGGGRIIEFFRRTTNSWGYPTNQMSGKFVLDSSMAKADAQKLLGDTTQYLAGGSGNEQGINATYRALERSKQAISSDNRNPELIREEAHLSVVVLTDEEETDEDRTNIKSQPQNLLTYVKNTWGGKKNMTFHSIIVRPGDADCKNKSDDHKYGYRYDEMSRLTGYGLIGGSIIGSVCANDYSTQLKDIGQSVRDMQNSVMLDCQPIDFDADGKVDLTINYRTDASQPYNPITVPYETQGQKLVFSTFLSPGDYQFLYKCIAP